MTIEITTASREELLAALSQAQNHIAQLEDQLQEERQFRTIVEKSPNAIRRFTPDLRYLYANPTAVRSLRKSFTSIKGLSLYDLSLLPGRAEFWEKTVAGVFASGKEHTVDYEADTAYGTRYYQAHLIPEFDQNNNVEKVLCYSRDVTELKKAQEELERREQQYRTLVENFPGGVARFDREGRYTYISPNIYQIAGLSVEDHIGRTPIETGTSPEMAQFWHETIDKVFETKEAQVIEFKYQSRTGVVRWYQSTYAPEFSKDGEVESVLSVGFNITKLKEAQEELFQREQEFRTLVENSPDIIVRYNREGRMLYVNPAIEKIIGLPPEKYINKKLEDIGLPAERVEFWNSLLEETFREGQQQTVSFALNTVNGLRYYQTRIVPELNSTGEITSILHISRSITRLKETEQALATANERLMVTLASIGDGVIATDTSGKITLINKAAELLTGWESSEAESLTLKEVFPIFAEKSGESELPQLIKVINDGAAFSLSGNTKLLTRDKVERILDGSAQPIRNQLGDIVGAVIVFTDITGRRKITEELQKTDKLESVGILAGGIAHDFNNFLAAILGNLAFIKRSFKPEDKLYKNLTDAEMACLHARSLTQQLLTFSKGGAPIKRATSINELLRETTTFALRGSNVRCQFDLPQNLWLADIDEGQISRVVNNLVINAQQAMPAGGILKVKAENIALHSGQESWQGVLLEPGSYVKISITDQGVGIPREYLSRIFDPYFTTKQEGSGLGLAVSYAIVKNHNGYITVDSEQGVGTTFDLYLPAPISTEQEANRVEVDSNKAATAKTKLRVLVMDDQELIRELIYDLLTDEGHLVTLTKDGTEAIASYKEALQAQEPFNAVIMDLTVPGGMGGQEAIKHLKQLNPDVRVIVSSGYSNDPVTSHYRDYGFVGVVPKPFDLDDLLRVLYTATNN